MNPDQRFELLWTDFLEGDLDADGMAELQSLLAQQSHLQERATDLLQTHRLLGFAAQEERTSAEVFASEVLIRLPKTSEVFVAAVMRDMKPAPPSLPRFPWLSWRPLTAAAAGIVFGMFCTSVAFAYVAPSLGKVITLLQEGFESGPAPLVTGVPSEPNVWSGDYSEIVLESEGVKPEDGWKMARLLRSDYEGRTEQGRSQQGDLMRVIDVRPYLGQSKSADVVMTLSAHFNAVPFPAAEHYQGLVMIYALDADKELPGRTEWDIEKNALAQCIGKCDVDRDPATWQAASTRLLLPAGTAFVMLKASMARKPGESEKLSSLPKSEVFAGHFVDGVDASILIRDAVPDHRTQASTHVAQ